MGPQWAQEIIASRNLSKCNVYLATPAGFECESNGAKPREDSSSPTENREQRSSKNRVVTLSGSKVAKLAAVAANAVRNYDLSRAIEVIEDLRRMGEGTR
jgi:hypothetical protein